MTTPVTIYLGDRSPHDGGSVAASCSAIEPIRDDVPEFNSSTVGEWLDDGGALDRLLTEYRSNRTQSELFRILRTASTMRDNVDQVVVLGAGTVPLGVRSFMAACCDPYFNDLDRGQRGSRPRMYFDGFHGDNDTTQGLLHLVASWRLRCGVHRDWAIVVMGDDDVPLSTEIAIPHFVAALRDSCSSLPEAFAQRLVVITKPHSRLWQWAEQLGCRNLFVVPDGVPEPTSLFTAAGLFPMSMLGMDVIRILEGVQAMRQHVRDAAPHQNLLLNYVGPEWNCPREIRTAVPSLRPLVEWHDAMQHQGAAEIPEIRRGRFDRRRVVTQIVVDRCRSDVLTSEPPWKREPNASFPLIMADEVASIQNEICEGNSAYREIHLPYVIENTLGQLVELLSLATAFTLRMRTIAIERIS